MVSVLYNGLSQHKINNVSQNKGEYAQELADLRAKEKGKSTGRVFVKGTKDHSPTYKEDCLIVTSSCPSERSFGSCTTKPSSFYLHPL